MLMLGGFLSTMLPVIGPTVAQFAAKSQTECVPVAALEVSVPAGTLVLKLKLPSEEFARPDPASLAEQGMLTSAGCQRLSGDPHVMDGGVLSSITTTCLGLSMFPALSAAEKETVVVPSVEIR